MSLHEFLFAEHGDRCLPLLSAVFAASCLYGGGQNLVDQNYERAGELFAVAGISAALSSRSRKVYVLEDQQIAADGAQGS